ncbi:hypothetical protein CDAR_491781 [Caerostris darwini]|uniref:Uncharacterized protein n=1 Tax=Caerostris darwini TaxID=1538125 RepID=A0AAV4MYY1_9ARAC|nr:hypothetical protein CDAR_491781 [Caerostris darwini]
MCHAGSNSRPVSIGRGVVKEREGGAIKSPIPSRDVATAEKIMQAALHPPSRHPSLINGNLRKLFPRVPLGVSSSSQNLSSLLPRKEGRVGKKGNPGRKEGPAVHLIHAAAGGGKGRTV